MDNDTLVKYVDGHGCGNTSDYVAISTESTDFVRLINVINGFICLVGLTGNVMVVRGLIIMVDLVDWINWCL